MYLGHSKIQHLNVTFLTQFKQLKDFSILAVVDDNLEISCYDLVLSIYPFKSSNGDVCIY